MVYVCYYGVSELPWCRCVTMVQPRPVKLTPPRKVSPAPSGQPRSVRFVMQDRLSRQAVLSHQVSFAPSDFFDSISNLLSNTSYKTFSLIKIRSSGYNVSTYTTPNEGFVIYIAYGFWHSNERARKVKASEPGSTAQYEDRNPAQVKDESDAMEHTEKSHLLDVSSPHQQLQPRHDESHHSTVGRLSSKNATDRWHKPSGHSSGWRLIVDRSKNVHRWAGSRSVGEFSARYCSNYTVITCVLLVLTPLALGVYTEDPNCSVQFRACMGSTKRGLYKFNIEKRLCVFKFIKCLLGGLNGEQLRKTARKLYNDFNHKGFKE
ncbi:hypothetical protein ScPMuIL_007986 [Solemya velum]